jgi:hypothetical protein
MFIFLSMYLFTYVESIHVSIVPFVYLPTYLSIRPPTVSIIMCLCSLCIMIIIIVIIHIYIYVLSKLETMLFSLKKTFQIEFCIRVARQRYPLVA